MKTLSPLPRLRWSACVGALSLFGSAQADAVDAALASGLPPDNLVRQIILSRPDVLAANAARLADAAEADRLRVGPYEYTLRVAGQQRRTNEPTFDSPTASSRFMESQIGVERTLRAPGKADSDEALGQLLRTVADVRRGDAIHEASRTLLRAWVDWLRDGAVVQIWQAQLQDQQALVRMAEKRVKAGDAARTEWKTQEAALAQVQAELVNAQAREASSRAFLAQRYPGLTQVNATLTPPSLSDLPVQDGARLQQQLADVSHEWHLARLLADLAKGRAQRTALERRVDPTLGVYAASERGGAEKLLGISLSIPLSGEARRAADRQAAAQAEQALEQARWVEQKVKAEASQEWLTAQSLYQSWQLQDKARQQQEEVLRTTIKGWQLGEFSQSDVLLARKQFMDAALAEVSVRAEARHAAWRLHLDLHNMWEFDEE